MELSFALPVTPVADRYRHRRQLAVTASLSREQETTLPEALTRGDLPRHVAVIMDGNSRWAKARGWPSSFGHVAGYKRFKELVWNSAAWRIPVLTVFAFSAENSRRSKDEVDFLWKMFEGFALKHLEDYHKKAIRICLIGDSTKMPKTLYNILKEAENLTRLNTGLQLVVAMGYSGQRDITQACQRIAHKVQVGELQPSDISESLVEQELETNCIPDFPYPDLLIRTSGELRLSNFLLWQSAYSELFFTDSYWPDFEKDDFVEALCSFQSRQRRFGGRTA